MPQEQVVTAEEDVGAFIEQRDVRHLLVCLAGVGGQHRGLEGHGVAHGGVGVAGREGGRAGMAAAAAQRPVPVLAVRPVLLRQEHAGDVHLAATDMAVQVDPGRHDHAAGEVHGLIRRTPVRGAGDDAAVLDPEVAHQAVDTVDRVVEAAARQLQEHPGPASLVQRG